MNRAANIIRQELQNKLPQTVTEQLVWILPVGFKLLYNTLSRIYYFVSIRNQDKQLHQNIKQSKSVWFENINQSINQRRKSF